MEGSDSSWDSTTATAPFTLFTQNDDEQDSLRRIREAEAEPEDAEENVGIVLFQQQQQLQLQQQTHVPKPRARTSQTRHIWYQDQESLDHVPLKVESRVYGRQFPRECSRQRKLFMTFAMCVAGYVVSILLLPALVSRGGGTWRWGYSFFSPYTPSEPALRSTFFEVGDGGDPFAAFAEHPFFGGGGGSPFGGGMRQPTKPKGPVDTTTYYKLLGVSKSATKEEITRAYRRLSIKNHPDKGGDKKKYQEIQEAYNCLSDKQKRQVYDKGGKEGLLEWQQNPMNTQNKRKKKMPTLTHKLKVQLEDVFNGKTKKIALRRTGLCDDCSGEGTLKEDASITCTQCGGRGQVMRMRQLGRGMIQQIPSVCPSCQGSGSGIPEKDKCVKCRGTGCQQERNVISIRIDKSMDTGDKIVMKGEADHKPGFRAGDLHVIVDVDKHIRFRREGDFLFYKKRITAKEALLGCSFPIQHLNNRTLWVTTDKVIQPGSQLIIPNKGMPRRHEPGRFGDMVVEFEVEFPKTLDESSRKELGKYLPGPEPREQPNGTFSIPELLPFDVEAFRRENEERERKKKEAQSQKKKKELHESVSTTEEEEARGYSRGGSPFGRGGAQQVQCQHQ